MREGGRAGGRKEEEEWSVNKVDDRVLSRTYVEVDARKRKPARSGRRQDDG